MIGPQIVLEYFFQLIQHVINFRVREHGLLAEGHRLRNLHFIANMIFTNVLLKQNNRHNSFVTKFLTRVLAMVTFPVGIGHSIPWSPHVSLQPFKSLVSTPSLILLEANRVLVEGQIMIGMANLSLFLSF